MLWYVKRHVGETAKPNGLSTPDSLVQQLCFLATACNDSKGLCIKMSLPTGTTAVTMQSVMPGIQE